MNQQPRKASFGRVLITPVIVMAAGFLVAGIIGLAVAGAVGIVYILWASRGR